MVYPPRHPNPPRPTLNAIRARTVSPAPDDDDAERRARHLRVCKRLIELGMTLAEAAADHALQDMDAPPPTQTIPASAAACVAEAEARLRHHFPDYGLVFARISRAVRQTVALENYIAAGCPARAAAPDPRRARLGAALHAATATHPDRAELRRDAAERLDWTLAQNPDPATPTEDLLQTICAELGLPDIPAEPQTERPAAQPAITPGGPLRPRPAGPRHKPNWRPPIPRNATA